MLNVWLWCVCGICVIERCVLACMVLYWCVGVVVFVFVLRVVDVVCGVVVLCCGVCVLCFGCCLLLMCRVCCVLLLLCFFWFGVLGCVLLLRVCG